TFSVTVPIVYRLSMPTPIGPVQAGRAAVLVIEDSDEDLMLFERALANTRFQVIPARSVGGAMTALDAMLPAAIILDLRLQGEDAWDFLTRLKREERTAAIPLIIASTIDDRKKGFALGASAYGVKPVERKWLLDQLEALVPKQKTVRVLTVDDEETYR